MFFSQGRKLDAVYYYMRSLAASNPFLTARESLMQLFEEAAKKVFFLKLLC
jgi:protein SMG6